MIKKYPASEFIKMAMEIKGWNNEDLAKHSKVNPKTISLLLKNQTPFTIKMDRLLGPALGFSVGVLSSIESRYLEWFNLQLENWKEINIDEFNFSYRKHTKVNEMKFKKTLIYAERKIREKAQETKENIHFDISNYFFNEYLLNINKINDLNSFYEQIIKMINDGVYVFLFNDVNIRGMSKKNDFGFFVFINTSLNRFVDSFIMTLTHEFLHHIDFNLMKTHKIKMIDDEKQEKLLDKIAMNYMLNEKMDFIISNDLFNVNIDVIQEYSDNLGINWIYYYGLKTYLLNEYKEKNNMDVIKIDFKDEIWKNIKI